MPARKVVGPAAERSREARHWPDQPMAAIMPSSPYCTLKNGNAPLEERPPSGASATGLARLDLGFERQEGALAADIAGQLVQLDRLAEVAGAQLDIEGLHVLRAAACPACRGSRTPAPTRPPGSA